MWDSWDNPEVSQPLQSIVMPRNGTLWTGAALTNTTAVLFGGFDTPNGSVPLIVNITGAPVLTAPRPPSTATPIPAPTTSASVTVTPMPTTSAALTTSVFATVTLTPTTSAALTTPASATVTPTPILPSSLPSTPPPVLSVIPTPQPLPVTTTPVSCVDPPPQFAPNAPCVNGVYVISGPVDITDQSSNISTPVRIEGSLNVTRPDYVLRLQPANGNTSVTVRDDAELRGTLELHVGNNSASNITVLLAGRITRPFDAVNVVSRYISTCANIHNLILVWVCVAHTTRNTQFHFTPMAIVTHVK